MIYPYLTYGIVLWGSTFQCLVNKLNVVQKKAIRCIDCADYKAHSSPIFSKLAILKIVDIYKLHVTKVILAHIRNELPPALQNTFHLDNDTHLYNTRQNDNKYRIKSRIWRTVVASQSILHNGPKIWNALESKLYINKNKDNTDNIVCVSSFTNRLKRCLCLAMIIS